ncbi:MAG: deiodinase-like protein [Gemmatales bacterium]|nr:hypothetical protein [Gemmatales bacterium]MDW7995452.1 deiodinase-like protein [Gemmatales bacterium]
MQFLLVYIREAHPDSLLHVAGDVKHVLEKIGQIDTLVQRWPCVQQCTAMLQLPMPAVVDKLDNRVNYAYAAWPERLVVVGVDGRIAYYGGPGPAGFRPAKVPRWCPTTFAKSWPATSASPP